MLSIALKSLNHVAFGRPAARCTTANSLAAAVGLSLACAAHAGTTPPKVVFSTDFDATNSIFVSGNSGPTVDYSVWSGISRSPDGSRFAFIAGLEGDPNDLITRGMVIGSTASPADAQLVIKRGDAIPGTPTRTVNLPNRARISDNGVFACTTNTSGSGSPSLFTLTGNAATPAALGTAFAIGTAIPGIDGATYAGTHSSLFIAADGRLGMQCGITDGIGTNNPMIIFDGDIIARAADAATAPTMFPGTGPDTWANFSLNRVMVSGFGNDLLWWGTTTGGLDVVALNNIAFVQEGSPLPDDPSGPNVLGFSTAYIESNGDWFVRGTLNDHDTDPALRSDFLVRNGATIAKRFDPVIPGSPMLWDRVNATSTSQGFLFQVGNDNGDYVVAGNYFIVDTAERGAVVVLNNETVVLFRGDGIDVDGNGMADDDAFIRGIKSEVGVPTAFLTDSGELWMNIDVEDGTGTDTGDAIIVLQLDLGGAPCPGDFNGDETVDLADLIAFNTAWQPNIGLSVPPGTMGDYNADGVVDLADLIAFNTDWQPNIGVPCP